MCQNLQMLQAFTMRNFFSTQALRATSMDANSCLNLAQESRRTNDPRIRMHLFCHFHRLRCPNESAAFFRCLNAFQAESSKLQSSFCSDDGLGTCSAVLSNHTLTFHSGQFNFLRSIGGIGLIHIPKAPVQKPVTIGIHIGIGVSLFIAAESSHFHCGHRRGEWIFLRKNATEEHRQDGNCT